MRLDDFDPDAVNIEDQRGSGGGGFGMPMGRRGGSIGCGTLIIVVIAALVMMFTGWAWLDPVVSLIISAVIVAGTWACGTAPWR